MALELKVSQKTSQRNKKFLQKEIPKLNNNEYREVFNIIRQNADATYSENSRGVYVNLKFLEDKTIDKIIEFIEYTKANKKRFEFQHNHTADLSNFSEETDQSDYKRFTLDKSSIEKELIRLRDKNNDHFTFQNFLDKLSVTNIKNFQQSSISNEKIVYPQLKHCKSKFDGVKARVLQKCRDVNKSSIDLPFMSSDEIDTHSVSDIIDTEEDGINKYINLNKIQSILSKSNEIDEIDRLSDLDESDDADDLDDLDEIDDLGELDELDKLDDIHHTSTSMPTILTINQS
jgi:hypothetical protein